MGGNKISQFLNKTNVKIKTSTKLESTILTHNMFGGRGGVWAWLLPGKKALSPSKEGKIWSIKLS
jgi:hypothetical protein